MTNKTIEEVAKNLSVEDLRLLMNNCKEVMVKKVLENAHSTFMFRKGIPIIEQNLGDIGLFFDFVKEGWRGMPANITCKVVTRRSQLPKWQDCPKDHVYVGVIRRNKGDRLIVVRHSFEADLSCTVPVEYLWINDFLLAVWPEKRDMYCEKCGEFTTRKDDKLCQDCS